MSRATSKKIKAIPSTLPHCIQRRGFSRVSDSAFLQDIVTWKGGMYFKDDETPGQRRPLDESKIVFTRNGVSQGIAYEYVFILSKDLLVSQGVNAKTMNFKQLLYMQRHFLHAKP